MLVWVEKLGFNRTDSPSLEAFRGRVQVFHDIRTVCRIWLEFLPPPYLKLHLHPPSTSHIPGPISPQIFCNSLNNLPHLTRKGSLPQELHPLQKPRLGYVDLRYSGGLLQSELEWVKARGWRKWVTAHGWQEQLLA